MKIEVEVLDKILEIIENRIFLGHHIMETDGIIRQMKKSGIEIEEEDYLEQAREIKKEIKENTKNWNAGYNIDKLYDAIDLYEKAIEQLQEELLK